MTVRQKEEFLEIHGHLRIRTFKLFRFHQGFHLSLSKGVLLILFGKNLLEQYRPPGMNI
jgi:hypothetical protein